MNINTSAVAGVMNIGGGFSQLEEIMCTMEIPIMSQNAYQNEHNLVCNGYEDVAIQTMKEAAKIEAELAIKEGDIDVDGMPLITVAADGSWCKRSYRTMYNSLSGMVSSFQHY